METVAKFKILEVTEFEHGYYAPNPDTKLQAWHPSVANRIKFQVVNSDKPENEAFAVWTPYGQMEMVVVNPALVGTFKVGKEYLFKISEA